MKITIDISDPVSTALRCEAARRGCSVSALVETALRQMLESKASPTELPPLPRFNSGGELVDIADREALYEAMDEFDSKMGR